MSSKRGRKSKPLHQDFEEILDDKAVVKCKSCSEASATGFAVTIQRGSIAKHLISANHTSSVAHLAERAAQAALDAQRLLDLQAATPIDMSDATFEPPDVSQPVNMFSETPDATRAQARDPWFHAFQQAQTIPVPYICPPQHDSDVKARQLEEEYQRLLRQAEQEDQFGVREDEDHFGLAEEMRQLDIDEEPLDPDEVQQYFEGVCFEADYSPYPNKLLMLLDILDNLPRLRLSSSLIRLIFWMLKELGVANVPSYDAFRKMQVELRKQCGSEPVRHESMLGNVFYTNSVRESIARDYANPEIVKHMQLYPEETEGPISETWQAERWKELDPSQRTPMYSNGLRQFYIEEVCELETGQLVIPHDWVVRNKVLTARCSQVSTHLNGWIIEDEDVICTASSFKYTYLDLVARAGNETILWHPGSSPPQMPNKLRDLANGDDLHVVMLPLWCDDVSGNVTKQYNKHINIYMVNGNLPGELNNQEFFTTFVSTSPHASGPEQFTALKKEIESTHTDPIRCFNAHTKRRCAVILRVPALPADNPQQSEEASHSGGNANCKCRKCKSGGGYEVTESDEGYDALHHSGILRTAEETRDCLQKQLDLACKGVKKPITDLQTATGTKDKIAQYWIDSLLKKYDEMREQNPRKPKEEIEKELKEWLKDQPGERMNPLLSIDGFDPTQDTPVEILHTILLGVMKYVWHFINVRWTDSDRATFAIRLQSLDLGGLNVPPVRATYMVQYKNNLIGKHFKTLMQTFAFVAHGLVTPQEFALIQAVGILGAALWVHEIQNMDTYLHDLEIIIGNVLDAFGDVLPDKIIDKMKLHILVHTGQDIRRFGPAVRFSTEIFECFNHIFRLCSIYSNHQAPSRDIGYKFASLDRVKHILSGGYWFDKEIEDWVCAGGRVLRVLMHEPIIQRHLGWVPKAKPIVGQVRTAGLKKNPPFSWEKTEAAKYLVDGATSGHPERSKWRKGLTIVAQSGDICRQGSWVFFEDQNRTRVGRISEIVAIDGSSSTRSQGFATVEIFEIADRTHPIYGLPFLRRSVLSENRPDSARCSVAKSSCIIFSFSAIHDCQTAKCEALTSRQVIQERETTTRTEASVKHKDDSVFLVNLYGLHNATLLRRHLPEALYKPKPIYEDRRAHHDALVKVMRVARVQKRAKTQEKAAATRKANQAKKRTREAVMEPADELPEDEMEPEDELNEHRDKRRRLEPEDEEEDIE